MNGLGTRQDPTRTGRGRVVLDSTRKVLTPQDLRTMEKTLGGAFQLEVYIKKISPLKVEIKLLRQSQKRLLT